jgi:hypothetical protein
VVSARGGLRVALARSKSIDGQDKEAQLHESQAARLDDQIAPGHRPVAVNHQHGGQFALEFRNIGISRHPHSRPALKDQLFNSIAVPFQKSLELWLERAWPFREWPHGLEHRLPQLGAALIPFSASCRRQVPGTKRQPLSLDKLVKCLGIALG